MQILSDAKHRRVARNRLVLVLGFMFICLLGCDATKEGTVALDHDSVPPVPPVLPEKINRPAVLVFSKTNGYRHAEGIEAGLPAFEAIAERRGWGFYATENGAVHNTELLDRFDAVVWFNVSGDVLSRDQKDALMEFTEAGGGFFGIHGTGGSPNTQWEDQWKKLVGARFIGHPTGPALLEATINVERPEHPVVQHLESEWVRTDEWYSFERSVRGPGFEVLATVDESTYMPPIKPDGVDYRMGEDHPIIWTHCVGKGRALFSALGHRAEDYAEPNHVQLLEEGVAWVAAGKAEGCQVGEN